MMVSLLFLFLFLNHNYNDAFFKPTSSCFFHNKKNHYLLWNVNDDNNSEQENNDLEIDTKSFHKILRLGRSKDQDGKSNIWSVEPTMEVVETKEGDLSEVNKNIVTFGMIVTGVIASLPILYTLNHFIMDMDY
jgi:hypothetical protein